MLLEDVRRFCLAHSLSDAEQAIDPVRSPGRGPGLARVAPVPHDGWSALIESYAILTRLPAQHRLTHADAFHLLRSDFSAARVAGPKTRDAWSMLRRGSVAPLGGSETYDAMIIDIAREAGAKSLLTFRRRELESLALPGIEIVEPV